MSIPIDLQLIRIDFNRFTMIGTDLHRIQIDLNRFTTDSDRSSLIYVRFTWISIDLHLSHIDCNISHSIAIYLNLLQYISIY